MILLISVEMTKIDELKEGEKQPLCIKATVPCKKEYVKSNFFHLIPKKLDKLPGSLYTKEQ